MKKCRSISYTKLAIIGEIDGMIRGKLRGRLCGKCRRGVFEVICKVSKFSDNAAHRQGKRGLEWKFLAADIEGVEGAGFVLAVIPASSPGRVFVRPCLKVGTTMPPVLPVIRCIFRRTKGTAILSVLPMRRPATITVVFAPISCVRALGLKINFLVCHRKFCCIFAPCNQLSTHLRL